MDDKQITTILVIITIVILGLTSILACLYTIPICFIRRFHTPLHLLSVNVCIAIFICTTYWAIYFTLNSFYPSIPSIAKSCLLIIYLRIMVNCQVLYALCMVSLNRLFTIVYKNKILFRTKKWVVICVSVQWILVTLITLPLFTATLMSCVTVGLELNYRIYILIISGVIPAISLAITNSIILIYARSSSRRVQTINGDSAPVPVLSHRDARLLKHMIFMFVVFFCGWEPAYIIGVVNWNGTTVSSAVSQAFRILPAVSVIIVIVDLFWYNHELRKYFTNQHNNNATTVRLNK